MLYSKNNTVKSKWETQSRDLLIPSCRLSYGNLCSQVMSVIIVNKKSFPFGKLFFSMLSRKLLLIFCDGFRSGS